MDWGSMVIALYAALHPALRYLALSWPEGYVKGNYIFRYTQFLTLSKVFHKYTM